MPAYVSVLTDDIGLTAAASGWMGRHHGETWCFGELVYALDAYACVGLVN